MISILGLLFPILFFSTLFLFLIWLFIKPKNSVLLLSALLLSIPSILKSFAINKTESFYAKKKPGSLRLLTWNVGLLNFAAKDHATAEQQNAILFDKLKELNADVICLQEFFTAVVPETRYNFKDSIIKTMGYPYHYFSPEISYFSNQFYSGNIVYSKYKIISSSRIVFPRPNNGALLKTSLLVDGDTVQIFTSHLQSVKFEAYEYQTIRNLKKASDPRLQGSGNIVKKLKLAFRERTTQIKIIDAALRETEGPLVFTGDMNEVPTGYAYQTFTKNLEDVWINTGYGIGKTFKYISPSLRIDYIFVSDHFKSLQSNRIISSASDHYGIVTDLILKKKLDNDMNLLKKGQ
ncbi:MAG: endonuclease/exonuclease/phosphatase family protein [Gloeobacteraceae cyanobacterium ES-bin-316]|nr:endonuclease/exonuclease/phosphatase family protein [Ferruginibacter sp.]